MTQDLVERQRQAMAEQAAAAEAARKANVETFTKMWLTLGADVLKLAGTVHDGEIAQAKGVAAARWNQLIGMEQQAEREEATLASRPKKRPISSTDDTLPDKFLEKQDQEWQEKTKYLHAALADLRKLAAAERKELESFTAKRR
jgi:hypothetical protein